MENVVPYKIQILSIILTFCFIFYIFRQIIKGKLREEYSIVWLFCTLIFLIFSFWRQGMEIIANSLGVFYPPSLLFLMAIGSIVVFLVHLSIVNSKLQEQVKILSQEIALLNQKENEKNLNE